MNIQKISVVIPIYNEAQNLPELITRLKNTLSKTKKEYELIFVDDNSTDQTDNIFQKRNRDQKIILLKKKNGKGKAYSLVEGFAASTGEAVVMIDADLQYAPEAIPGMIEELQNADIVVANRKHYKDSLVRKTLSRTFRVGFGKFLFGLDHDIQSGLKVFSREVIQTISFNPASGWTFDLEMLHIAHHAGYVIKNYDIDFEKRKNGHSSINIVKTAFDIGINSLKLRAKRIQPVIIKPTYEGNMLGAGYRYKKKLYVTHTTLPHHVSAMRTFTFLQKTIITLFVLSIIIGLFLKPLLTLQALVALLSTIYFIDVFFNLFLILKSLSFPQEIVSTDEELAKIQDKDLPIYTILCPLYREAHVIPQFLNAIKKLSYPKEKLDVLLLLEEDDKESIASVERMKLPSFVRTIVVPHSIPKTKPKACNYGLTFARGEYLVIFDAEDIPEPMQLKKAFLGFKKVPANTICLQAKLNYYNPHQNLLTRFFTAEYSLWFDVTLTGLQSINTTIPLGGTSNHFKIESLKKVEGWDPFNVTEDADLGMRLFKRGYKTAIIDSVTLEEANSKYGNWLRQRSRWIKGYMQTYLVHTRETLSFTKEQGIHSLIFQLIVGGKIAFVLINPILWLATIAYFVLYAYVGPQIEALYPSVVFYMAVISLVFGNFLFLYYYMIGAAKKGQWTLMKFVFLIPIYWIMISIAAFIALYQLIFKPHYWEKTVHGFHLLKTQKIQATVGVEKVVYPDPVGWRFAISSAKIKISKEIKERNQYFAGIFYIGAIGVGSIFSFLYSAYLGRALDLEDFGLISLIAGLYSLISIIPGALSATVSHRTGYLIGKYNEETAFNFWKHIRRKSISISVIFSLIWIALSPYLVHFFKTGTVSPFILFSPIIFSILAYSIDRGFLSSRLNFVMLGILVIFESILKFGLAFLLVELGLKTWTYMAIPLSVFIAFVLGWIFVLKSRKKAKAEVHEESSSFPKKFFFASLMSGLSSVILMSLDVVLAKHYLSARDAGLYSLAALIAKMIFFLGAFASPFIFPLVSRNEGANKDSKKILRLTLIGTLIFTLPGFIAFGALGNFTIPFLFGKKAIATIPYLLPMSTAMLCYSFARVYGNYYLAKKYYSFSAIALLVGVLQIALIILFHQSVLSMVYVMTLTWILYFVVTIIMHIFAEKVKIIENNLVDFVGLFKQFKKPYARGDKLRILILNWRDTRHKWAGGAEVYVHELAKHWVKEGNSVTVFCGNGTNWPKNEIIDGVQIYRRGGFYTVYVWALLYYLFKFRGKYDVIIDSENGIPFFTPLYTNIHKFLLIHHVHQEIFRKSLKWPLSTIALFLEAKLMPLVYRNAQVVTVSPSSKEEIIKHKLTKKDPIIIYNGVDTAKFKPGEKNEKPLILYLGRLQRYKSLDVFIKAAKGILEKIPEAEFVIAGEGEEKINLIKLAEKLGISQKIKFLGKVTEEEKIELFQKAWIFMNPSLLEGWGITTIEANACGTPTIASNVPGLRDSVSNLNTGLLVEYGDYGAFAQDAIILIKDNKLRKEMSIRSLEWAQKYSWEQSATTFYGALSEHLEKNPKIRKANRLAYVLNRLISLL